MVNTLNAGQVRIAGNGNLWKAPIGTTLPTDSTTAWDSAFVNLGYATDGFEMAQDYKTKQIDAWQTLEPVRIFGQSLTRKFSFELLQSNKDTLGLAWGGAAVSFNGTPVGGAVTIGTGGVLTTATAHGLTIGTPVVLTGVATATGISSGVVYFVIATTTLTVTLSATKGGVALTTTTGTATSIASAAPFALTIPEPDVVNEFILGIDWVDGSISNRFIIPRATLLTLPTIKYVRTDAVRYAMEIQAVKPADGSKSVLVYGLDAAAVGA